MGNYINEILNQLMIKAYTLIQTITSNGISFLVDSDTPLKAPTRNNDGIWNLKAPEYLVEGKELFEQILFKENQLLSTIIGIGILLALITTVVGILNTLWSPATEEGTFKFHSGMLYSTMWKFIFLFFYPVLLWFIFTVVGGIVTSMNSGSGGVTDAFLKLWDISGQYFDEASFLDFNIGPIFQGFWTIIVAILLLLFAIIIKYMQTLVTIILIVLGPIAIALSIFPKFKDSFDKWLKSFVALQLWAVVMKIIDSMIISLLSLKGTVADAGNSDQAEIAGAEFITSTIPPLLLVVGYMYVPQFVSLIMSDGGLGKMAQSMAEDTKKTAKTTAGGAALLTGLATGGTLTALGKTKQGAKAINAAAEVAKFIKGTSEGGRTGQIQGLMQNRSKSSGSDSGGKEPEGGES